MPTPSNWYEDFFQGLALEFWRNAMTPDLTEAEVNFILQTLECSPSAKLLDVPCGNGRHSLLLAGLGYRVTGIDLSEEFILEARRSAAEMQAQAEFLLGDMRSFEGGRGFDGAFCLGNSFGYLTWPDMKKFLDCLSGALKPSSRFLLYSGAVAECLLPSFKQKEVHQLDDIQMRIENRYLAEESCLETNYTFEQAGQVESKSSLHWVYTAAEIQRMLQDSGLETLDLYGSLDQQPFSLGSQQLFLIAQKKA